MNMQVRLNEKVIGYLEWEPDLLNNVFTIDGQCYMITAINGVDNYVKVKKILVVQGKSLPAHYEVFTDGERAGIVQRREVTDGAIFALYGKVFKANSIDHSKGRIDLREMHVVHIQQ